jgi:aminoglycoside phosphotransferase (APT) family kinase protein
MREALSKFISAQMGVAVEVVDVRRITVGHSRAMYRVECNDGALLVLRMEQGGVFGTSSTEEFAVMRWLHAAGVPVANVRWYEPTGSVLGQPFFLMDFIAGAESADERLVDQSVARSLVGALSELHRCAVDPSASPFVAMPAVPSDATHLQIERWAGVYRAASPVPIPLLEEAAAWLHHHAPALSRLSVVHGDAGPGNFVHAEGAVVAITDWEFAHVGDPAEDWVYCAAMRGSRTMDRGAWVTLFSDVGVELSVIEWRYWEAFNLFKGACANRTCLSLFESGANRAPNMAIIGTSLHQAFLRRLADLVCS